MTPAVTDPEAVASSAVDTAAKCIVGAQLVLPKQAHRRQFSQSDASTKSTALPNGALPDAETSEARSTRGRSQSSVSIGDAVPEVMSAHAAATLSRSSPAVVTSAPTGDFITDYALGTGVLGTGASGSVREAACRQTGRRVAVKSFQRSAQAHRVWERARNECNIHRALCHPHIVTCEGVYGSGNALHLVMEAVEGGDLFERITSSEGFSEEMSARMAVQLLRALGYLHSRRIVHRDIKPENILLQEETTEVVKLADFGFAIRRTEKHELRQLCGTTQYIAPEMAAGRSYDEKVDMWSFGCVVYAMLLAKQFHGSSDAKLFKESATAESTQFSPSFQRLSDPAQDFVRALLAVDVAKRLSVRQALEHPWLKLHVPQEREIASKEVASEFEVQQALRQSDDATRSSRSNGNVDAVVSCFAAVMPGCGEGLCALLARQKL